MTLVMHDAVGMLSPLCSDAYKRRELSEALYADDTIIFGSSAEFVQEYAQAVQTVGARYGLALHWGKTQALSVGTEQCLRRPDGTAFDKADFLEYLGGLISRDGRADSEISRKIGRAYAYADLVLAHSIV